MASDTVSPPLQDVEMQDPPCNEGVAHVVVEAREVPAIEVARTKEVLAIDAKRTQDEPSEGVRTPPAKEEGDGTVSGKLVASAKLAQGLVEVNLLPRSWYSRLVLVAVVL